MKRSLKQAREHPERLAKEADRDFQAPPDQEILDEGLRAVLPELFLEAGRNGPAGIVKDYAVAHSRWVAAQIPSAELTVWPGAGHLHTPDRWAELYATLN